MNRQRRRDRLRWPRMSAPGEMGCRAQGARYRRHRRGRSSVRFHCRQYQPRARLDAAGRVGVAVAVAAGSPAPVEALSIHQQLVSLLFLAGTVAEGSESPLNARRCIGRHEPRSRPGNPGDSGFVCSRRSPCRCYRLGTGSGGSVDWATARAATGRRSAGKALRMAVSGVARNSPAGFPGSARRKKARPQLCVAHLGAMTSADARSPIVRLSG